jgi:hypothetical protein
VGDNGYGFASWWEYGIHIYISTYLYPYVDDIDRFIFILFIIKYIYNVLMSIHVHTNM